MLSRLLVKEVIATSRRDNALKCHRDGHLAPEANRAVNIITHIFLL